MNPNRRLVRLLIFALIAALCVLIYPRVLEPLHGDEMMPAVIVVCVVVVAVRRLTERL